MKKIKTFTQFNEAIKTEDSVELNTDELEQPMGKKKTKLKAHDKDAVSIPSWKTY